MYSAGSKRQLEFEKRFKKAIYSENYSKLEKNEVFIKTVSPDNLESAHYKNILTDKFYKIEPVFRNIPYANRGQRQFVFYFLNFKKQ